MGDKARTEDDSNAVRAKYAKLEEDIRTADWSGLSECTFYTLERLIPSNS